MQVQNHVWAPANMTVITAILSVPINMVLVRYYDFWGAALATSVARGLLLVLLVGESSPVPFHMPLQPQRHPTRSLLQFALRGICAQNFNELQCMNICMHLMQIPDTGSLAVQALTLISAPTHVQQQAHTATHGLLQAGC